MSCDVLGIDDQMADRKAELEKKRKKLEELKRAREQNKLQAKDKEVNSIDPDSAGGISRALVKGILDY